MQEPSKPLKVAVVGSGPSGISAAKALLEQGVAVTLIDSGQDVPEKVVHASKAVAEKWSTDPTLESIQYVPDSKLHYHNGFPLKTLFGSTYPYDFNDAVTENGASLIGSAARGGFSSIWGASIFPASREDTEGWPITLGDLEPHYRSVLSWVPHAQCKDDLCDSYALYSDVQRPLKLSAQANALLRDLVSAREKLRKRGLVFGRSRLAVRDCEYCGLCLYGCPQQFIYNTAQTLEELLGHPGFEYISNARVTDLEEHEGHVDLILDRDRATRKMSFSRAFLGCGVLNTSMLVARLTGVSRFIAKDCAYFIVPFLRFSRSPQVSKERLHSLAQLFIELEGKSKSDRHTHLQLYSYNYLYEYELARKLGVLSSLLQPLARATIERLLVIQGYISSADSHRIRIDVSAESGVTTLSCVHNPATRGRIRAAVWKLLGLAGYLKGVPLVFATEVSTPGRSFHTGATLPMAANPGANESDVLGRPAGLKRVHIVDASVLPDVPAKVTLTTMANAHRIASLYPQYASLTS